MLRRQEKRDRQEVGVELGRCSCSSCRCLAFALDALTTLGIFAYATYTDATAKALQSLEFLLPPTLTSLTWLSDKARAYHVP